MEETDVPTYPEHARRLSRALVRQREPEIVAALANYLQSLARSRPVMFHAALRGVPLVSLAMRMPIDADVDALDSLNVLTASELASIPPTRIDTWFMDQVRSLRNAGRKTEAVEVTRRLRQRLQNRAQREPGAVVALAPVALQLGISEAVAGNHVAAASDLRAAARWADDADSDLALEATIRAAAVDAARGRLREAQRILDELPPRPAMGATPRSEFLRTLAKALLAVERLAPDAEQLLLRSDALEQEDDFWIFLTLACTRWEIANGGFSAALERVSVARTKHAPLRGSFADAILVSLRSSALTHLGEYGAARRELAESAVDDWAELRVVLARVLLIEGRDDQSRMLLRGLIREEQIGPVIRTEALLLDLWRRQQATGKVDVPIAKTARVAIEREGLARVTTTVPRSLARAVDAEHHMVEVADIPLRPTLRPSQQRVLAELSKGKSVGQIAGRLQLSANTVRTHIKAIYRRLDSHSRAEAVEKARDLGFIDETPDA
ncbi:hypothetical protein GCM10027421_32300 [Microbacterium shaanxiense]